MNSIKRILGQEVGKKRQEWKLLSEELAKARYELAGEVPDTTDWLDTCNKVNSIRSARDDAFVRKLIAEHNYREICAEIGDIH